MADLPIIQLRDHNKGIIHEDIVDDVISPSNSVNEAINVNFDVMGAVQLREGTTILGNNISSSDILGLHQFLDEGTGTDDQLIAVNGDKVYYLNGATWANVASVTSGLKARFTNFLDRAMMVNGTDTVIGWDGSGAFDTTNLANAPIGHYIDNYRSRVWIANTDSNPSRLYYSTVASSSGAITWSTSQFIDVSPGDGEDITGLKRYSTALLVFKPNHTYRVFGINEADPDPQIPVGTYSQESVVETKAGIFFHDWNNAAIHQYTGGMPVEVSKPIKPYLEGVTLANRDDVAGWQDGDNVYWSVGDITLNGVTFGNVVFRYTISTEVWTIYSYPTQFLVGTMYDDGLTREPIVGDEDGNVFRFNYGNTDNGNPIVYSLVTKWHDLSGVRAYTDTITQLATLHRNAQGAVLQYQIDNPDSDNEWEDIGELSEAPVDIFDTEIRCHKVRFRLSGTSTGEKFIYQGIEILKAFSDLVIE